MSENDDVLNRAAQWLGENKGVALATVVGTWGSSPRPPGSMLAIEEGGAFVGSVSGGCVEGAVVSEAQEVIAGAPPRVLDYGVSDEQAWEVGLACGGELKVFLERAVPADVLRALLEERPAALVSHLASGAHAVVRADSVNGDLDLAPETVEETRLALRDNRSTSIEDPGGAVFARVFNPPLRMIIVGAVHISQSLAPMAALSGFDVTVVDPRGTFATVERFPGVSLSHQWPDEALAALAPDSRTAVVTLTHDPKLDDPALQAALDSDVFYIGALGSRRTHAKRLERLRTEGFGDDELARIYGPAGFDLGGRASSEIAVAVLAEAIAASHGKRSG
ncbi:MAG TPA: XdhC family protein [Rhodospirillales bacterium]|jgi:xanthine dehydrogenase accessory factor|nr:XdhC family protein [Rhodospirillales bacterium]